MGADGGVGDDLAIESDRLVPPALPVSGLFWRKDDIAANRSTSQRQEVLHLVLKVESVSCHDAPLCHCRRSQVDDLSSLLI